MNQIQSVAFTEDHHTHRLRRESLNPYFGMRCVTQAEDMTKAKVGLLCERIEQHRKMSRPINLSVAYVAVTMDVICQYCFGEYYELLATDDFSPAWRDAINGVMRNRALFSHLLWLPRLQKMLPTALVKLTAWHLSVLLRYKTVSIFLFSQKLNRVVFLVLLLPSRSQLLIPLCQEYQKACLINPGWRARTSSGQAKAKNHVRGAAR